MLILNTQVAQSCVLFWCGLKVSPLAPIKLHSGMGVSGGKGRRKMQSPSIVFTSVCLGAEFIAVKQEEGGMRRRGKKGGWHRVAECVYVRVLTQSKSICPLWNCGHKEGKGVQTQPGHMQAGTSNYSAG